MPIVRLKNLLIGQWRRMKFLGYSLEEEDVSSKVGVNILWLFGYTALFLNQDFRIEFEAGGVVS